MDFGFKLLRLVTLVIATFFVVEASGAHAHAESRGSGAEERQEARKQDRGNRKKRRRRRRRRAKARRGSAAAKKKASSKKNTKASSKKKAKAKKRASKKRLSKAERRKARRRARRKARREKRRRRSRRISFRAKKLVRGPKEPKLEQLAIMGAWDEAAPSTQSLDFLRLARGLGNATTELSKGLDALATPTARAVLEQVPVRGKYELTSKYGYRRHPTLRRRKKHKGIDLAAKSGTPVLAAGSGKVTKAGRHGAYGRVVFIDHGDGVETRYAHLRRVRVRKGQKVRTGQRIGAVGRSGRATGPHLHFEVRTKGRAVNPLKNVGFTVN